MNYLKNKYKNTKICLASGSPRRQDLLKGLDIPFRIETKEVAEIYPSHLKAEKITNYLARLKAEAFTNLDKDVLLITADTIVWLDDEALMKPENKEEARQLLLKISGKAHIVYTSVCLRNYKKIRVFSDKTTVYFKKLNADEINYYIDNYKPFDKAGAYGAQDWIGYIAIEKLEGSYFNVMGLPVHKLYNELLDF